MTEVAMVRYRANVRDKHYREEEKGWAPISEASGITDEYAQNRLTEVEFKAIIDPLLPKLRPQWRRVVECRFFDDLTFEETAHVIGVTKERVRQIQASALEKLRNSMNSKEWDSRIKIAMNSDSLG